ncbi:MAG TPA: hypothetical protein ENN80_11675, partial [Candidatus Hydrogenedentes bacterium]|nr:hypothetical protein [Candidatus Hydrogenedentota bacterium]
MVEIRKREQRDVLWVLRCLAAVFVAAFVFGAQAFAAPMYSVMSDGSVTLVDSEVPELPGGAPQPDRSLDAGAITFNITYDDPLDAGFNDPTYGADRKARLEAVLTYVGEILGELGTLDVLVYASNYSGTGRMVIAGTDYNSTSGWQNGNIYERLRTGEKPRPGFAELRMKVNWGFNWYVGSGQPAPDEYDLFSVLLREITRALGVTTLANSDGSSSIGTSAYSVWDSFLETGTGVPLFVENEGTPTFSPDATQADLTGARDGVVF